MNTPSEFPAGKAPTPVPRAPAVVAESVGDPGSQVRGFRLRHAGESVDLLPGATWVHLDRYKWVTRGLIEAPQSFTVHPDGSVDLNGTAFSPLEPDAAAAFTQLLNRVHTPAPHSHPKHPTTTASQPSSPATQPSGVVTFHLHLDPMGHAVIEAHRDGEKTSTGLRGLAHLASDGWMRLPGAIHVDPLQRHLEIEGRRWMIDEAGVRDLEAFLNANCRPDIHNQRSAAIEIRESPGASTGFDIHFQTVRAGTRFDVRGHLSQEKLDILQDHEKCGLLRAGTILRLAPPYLYVRRRRPDGGEEHVPGIPDVKYRGLPAPELQRILNHPSIRPAGEASTAEPAVAIDPRPEPIHTSTPHAPTPPPVPEHPAVPSGGPAVETAPVPRLPPTTPTPPPARHPSPPPSPIRPEIQRLFASRHPVEVNRGVFRELAERLHLPPQDLLLSLPRVFEDREFEILSFDGSEIGSILELRGARFFGIYLTHLSGDRTDLVYACRGTHLEWGTDQCALQPEAGAETVTLQHAGLLGLAQDENHHFVFVVTERAREWFRPYEKHCAAACARFATTEEWFAHGTAWPLIWPTAAPGSAAA